MHPQRFTASATRLSGQQYNALRARLTVTAYSLQHAMHNAIAQYGIGHWHRTTSVQTTKKLITVVFKEATKYTIVIKATSIARKKKTP